MSIKVLIADDSGVMRKIIVRATKAAGVDDIVEAVDGAEALAKFDQDEFDLVLTDWNMPNKTGLEVIQEIRAKGSKVPIIMVTTEGEKSNVLKAIEAGVTDYLTKPFEAEALSSKIDKLALAQPVSLASVSSLLFLSGQDFLREVTMNSEYINPFIESTIDVFKTMLSCEVHRTGLSLEEAFEPQFDVTGVIGLSGKASGDVVISFESSLALWATETFLGEECDEITADVIDTVGELTNMIAGHAKSSMESLELSLALPTVIVGKNHSIRFPSKVKPISMPFESDKGRFHIEIGLVDQVQLQ